MIFIGRHDAGPLAPGSVGYVFAVKVTTYRLAVKLQGVGDGSDGQSLFV